MLTMEVIWTTFRNSTFWATRYTYGQYVMDAVLIPLVAALGLVGNSLIVAILTRKDMITPTYCILTGLAISDMGFVMIHGPNYFAKESIDKRTTSESRFVFAGVYEIAWYGFSAFFVTTTCWLTAAAAIERFLSLRFSARRRFVCTFKRAMIMVLSVYITALLLNLPRFLEHKINDFQLVIRTWAPVLIETQLGKNEVYKKLMPPLAVCVVSVPIVIMVIANALLLHFLLAHRRQMSQIMPNNRGNMVDVLHVGIVVFTVVLIFLISYLPTLIMFVRLGLLGDYDAYQQYGWTLSTAGRLLLVINSSANFVVYTIINAKFRKTLIGIFMPWPVCCKKRNCCCCIKPYA